MCSGATDQQQVGMCEVGYIGDGLTFHGSDLLLLSGNGDGWDHPAVGVCELAGDKQRLRGEDDDGTYDSSDQRLL